jgi:2-oxoglutarate ferredoxin oxidoreductase subunit beta
MEPIQTDYPDEQLERVRKQDFLKYRSPDLPTWCPGCGYFGIMDAFYKACRKMELKFENICTVSGIGCSGRTPIFVNSYGFHTLHEDLTVFAVAGDGDALGIGGGHLPHAARKNIDITLLLFDNSIYGLTKGQSSSTTPYSMATSSHPSGNPDQPLNAVKLALAYGASFVARGFAGDPEGLEDIICRATEHNGFSFVHILTPCVTFDKENFTWKRLRENAAWLDSAHDSSSLEAAVRLAEHEPFRLGIFFRDTEALSYQENLRRMNA